MDIIGYATGHVKLAQVASSGAIWLNAWGRLGRRSFSTPEKRLRSE